jgi:hypothetical protein
VSGNNPTAPDLVAAVVARVRAYDGGAVAAALGEDTGTAGGTKVWAGEAMGSPNLPWLRVTEAGEAPSYTTGDAYTARGMLQVSVFHSGRKAARDVGRLVKAALNRAPLAFDDGRVMTILAGPEHWPPSPDVGPGQPAVHHYAVTFDYWVQRSL